jgi:hypothetical protein
MQTPDDRLLTVPELARRSGVDVKALRGAVRRGELRASYPGERETWPRVRWADFEAWLNSRWDVPEPLQLLPGQAERVAQLEERLVSILGPQAQLRPHVRARLQAASQISTGDRSRG